MTRALATFVMVLGIAAAHAQRPLPVTPPAVPNFAPPPPSTFAPVPREADGCQVLPGIRDINPTWQTVVGPLLEAFRATATVADSVDFKALGAVRVEVSRWSETMTAPVTVRLMAKPESLAPYTTICELRDFPLGKQQRSVVLQRALKKDAETLLRLEVFDAGEGGPTGDLPYTIVIAAESLPIPASGSNSPALFKAMESPPPGPKARQEPGVCEVIDAPKRKKTHLERVSAFTLHVGDQPWTHLSYFEAGRNVYVRISRTSGVTAPLRLRLTPKQSGMGEFMRGCVADDPRNDGRSLVLGSIESRYLYFPSWRVELEYGGRVASSSPGEVLVEIFRDVDPERRTAPGVSSLATSFSCHGLGPGQRTMPSISAIPFAQSTLLRVSVRNKDAAVPAEAVERLKALILEVVALWRESCRSCRVDNLFFVELDKELYWLPNVMSADDGGSVTEWRLARAPMVRYYKTSRDSAPLQAFCALPLDKLPPEFRRVGKVIGCPAAIEEKVQSAELILLLQRGKTSCGADPNIVACEPDGELVELNLADYTFHESGPGGAVMGWGPLHADLFHVLLHEAGHWVGLDHIEDGESVMTSSMDDSRCINTDTALAIGRRDTSNWVGPKAFRMHKSKE